MTAPRADRPAAGQSDGWPDGPPLPRWALWLMLPGIVAPVLVFVFIVVSESAHDRARCPYRELTRQQLGADVAVIEEARNCVGDVEEHRYTLRRGGQSRLLGERRFDKTAFAPGRYRWTATVTHEGEVRVVVHNQGHADLLLREGTAEERAKGISY